MVQLVKQIVVNLGNSDIIVKDKTYDHTHKYWFSIAHTFHMQNESPSRCRDLEETQVGDTLERTCWLLGQKTNGACCAGSGRNMKSSH